MKAPLPRIYLDMDGVLSRWVKKTLELFNSPYKEGHNTTEYVGNLLGVSNNEIWKHINACGESFWTELEKYPWADDVVNAARELDPNFAFLTSPGRSPWAAAGKIRWLEHHYPNDYTRFIFTGLKETCAAPGRILVDDSEGYMKGWQAAGGSYVLAPRPWNNLRHIPDASVGTNIINKMRYAASITE